jgi:membrane protease subunit HflK
MGHDNENDNDKKQNPWGSKNQKGNSPWGSGGGHRGHDHNQSPEIDEMLRRAQDNLRGIFPNGLGGGKIVILAILGVVALWLASGFYIINPGEHGVIQRFGAWNRTQTAEGLGYHMPFPVEVLSKVKVNEIRRMNIGFLERGTTRSGVSGAITDVAEESQMLTSDRNIVDLDMVIQWNIKSAEDYLFEIEDQENTIKKVAESAIREVVGQTNMFPIITTERTSVADRTKLIIQKNLDEYNSGVNITQVLIQQAEVHPDVQAAFQDVQSAKQDADDVQNRAQAYREDILPKARGAAIQMLQEAQGYEQSVTARANGDADRFNSVLEAYQTGKDVTRQRMYLETMENVLQHAQKIILDENNGNGGGVVPYLPLNELKPAAGNVSKNTSGSSQPSYLDSSSPYR